MLNEKLKQIHNELDSYFLENEYITPCNKKEINLVLDIEVCPNEQKNEAITYSIAIMECDTETDICYKFNDVEKALNMLLGLNTEKVNIYVHNLYYDIKPFIVKFIELYGNNTYTPHTIVKNTYNIFKKKKEKLTFLNEKERDKPTCNTYNLCLKKGQLYGASFYGNMRKHKNGTQKPIEIRWHDTYKLAPYSLAKCCSAFLDLQLPKDGLDYDKVRDINEELTKEEKIYIYNDVFGLKYLVKKLVVDGFEINGRKVKYTKITNSSQSLYDYKMTLHDDYLNKRNSFSNAEFYDYVDTLLLKKGYHNLKDKQYDLKIDMVFKSVYPPMNYFEDAWSRLSYYGGLSTVDFKNVKKYEKVKNKKGVVLDVNSLYPYIMSDRLLPFGIGSYSKFSYKKKVEQNPDYAKSYPLYIQEITIHDMKLKRGKMAFVQVKQNIDFNGREVIEENKNKYGEKVSIKLVLTNVLIDLLFENYNVKSYTLGCHMAYQGTKGLFTNYLEYWAEIKKNSKGANREIAKLRQNALYGKFGTSGDNTILNVDVKDGVFGIENKHESYVTDNIYVVMSSFITSYAKEYLVKAINDNRERFLYCDTDSLHLFGVIEEVKGVEIDSKKYGCWDNEFTFDDFRYIGAKRYAERNIKDGTWNIKCCGLTDTIMKQVDDINVFQNCKISGKELKKMKLYTNDSIYYFKDEKCTEKVVGLIKSKKSKIVKNGTLIIEQPYMLNGNSFIR